MTKNTGAAVKARVMEVLKRPPYEVSKKQRNAVALLAPCVVLTPGEAAKICGAMQLVSHGILTEKIAEEWAECRALLTPDTRALRKRRSMEWPAWENAEDVLATEDAALALLTPDTYDDPEEPYDPEMAKETGGPC
jgi:hypothetical protein